MLFLNTCNFVQAQGNYVHKHLVAILDSLSFVGFVSPFCSSFVACGANCQRRWLDGVQVNWLPMLET